METEKGIMWVGNQPGMMGPIPDENVGSEEEMKSYLRKIFKEQAMKQAEQQVNEQVEEMLESINFVKMDNEFEQMMQNAAQKINNVNQTGQ